MAIGELEAAFRAEMRVLARKGGAATKRRHGYDPRYYRDIGRLGGFASVAARKAKLAAGLDAVKPGEAPTVEAGAAPAEAPSPRTRRAMTLREILADAERMGPRAADVSNRRQSVEDRLAEESFARFLAQIQQQSGDVEPWDPWSRRQ